MMMRRRRKMEASQFGNKLMKWFEGGWCHVYHQAG